MTSIPGWIELVIGVVLIVAAITLLVVSTFRTAAFRRTNLNDPVPGARALYAAAMTVAVIGLVLLFFAIN
ncbi:hypothetical protein [Glaciihabitans sp. dw_435]|uniref:hypothetical protein n=1 Tax=Glaciihabitans sp. dw_435 TaxID=2720081 RepID=UPI001BD4E060|nr:hypothetical protein [Glaciihabitans sp. dw_435]